MLQYPSIPKQIIQVPIYAFDKIDGSNVRVEWTPKAGFCKWGSRSRLLDVAERPLGEAVEIFHRTMADQLEPVLRKIRNERVTLFMEFAGPSSFAGNHVEGETHSLTLFDVSLYKRGFMLPNQFIRQFDAHVPTPGLLYCGKANQSFIDAVHAGEVEDMTFEGVVCKSQELHRGQQVVFKIKNDAWLAKLRQFTKGDGEMFRRLS